MRGRGVLIAIRDVRSARHKASDPGHTTSKLVSQAMNDPHPIPKNLPATLLLAATFLWMAPIASHAAPQHTALEQTDTTPHRTRLILKDGSYQIVMSYRIVGDLVRYVSAERGGAEEDIPVALVDFDATHRWEKQHTKAS